MMKKRNGNVVVCVGWSATCEFWHSCDVIPVGLRVLRAATPHVVTRDAQATTKIVVHMHRNRLFLRNFCCYQYSCLCASSSTLWEMQNQLGVHSRLILNKPPRTSSSDNSQVLNRETTLLQVHQCLTGGHSPQCLCDKFQTNASFDYLKNT